MSVLLTRPGAVEATRRILPTGYWKGSGLAVLLDALAALLRGGAAVDAVSSDGVTALMMAAYNGRAECARLLLEAGADVAQVDEFGRTADSLAEEKGFGETAAAVKEFAARAAG